MGYDDVIDMQFVKEVQKELISNRSADPLEQTFGAKADHAAAQSIKVQMSAGRSASVLIAPPFHMTQSLGVISLRRSERCKIQR